MTKGPRAGAEVNVDNPHGYCPVTGVAQGPDAPHVGWKTPGNDETIWDEFYLTNADATFLLCVNDHDVLIGAGTAVEWVREL